MAALMAAQTGETLLPAAMHLRENLQSEGASHLQKNVRIVYFVFLHDALHHFLVHVCQWHRAIEVNAPSFLFLEINLRRISVQADADRIQLSSQNLSMAVWLDCIQHHEQEVCALAHSNHLHAMLGLCKSRP